MHSDDSFAGRMLLRSAGPCERSDVSDRLRSKAATTTFAPDIAAARDTHGQDDKYDDKSDSRLL